MDQVLNPPLPHNPYLARRAQMHGAQMAMAAGATPFQFRWLCALILSFCYELPLYQLTGMDRLNPRLFDLVAISGIFILLFQTHNLRRVFDNRVFRYWTWLVIWFSVCAAIWATLWLPWGTAGKYSVYYALKYVEGLFCLYLVAAIPLTSRQKHRLHWMVVVGGLVVAFYAIFEKLRLTPPRYVGEEQELKRPTGSLFSCLGTTYFHVASYSALSSGMAFALANRYRPSLTRLFLYFCALFCAWPAALCGSRAGLAILLVVLAGVFFFMKRTRLTLIVSAVFVLLGMATMFTSGEAMEKAQDVSLGVRRLVGGEKHRHGNSIFARITMGMEGLLGSEGDAYSWQGNRLPLIGGGFYAVPHSSHGRIIKYRTGYGVHNAYLFPYEQAGIPGVIIAAAFLIAAVRWLIRMVLHTKNETDRQFAIGMWCVLLAFIPAAWFGQIFWRGFGTENFNSYILILLVLATRSSIPVPKKGLAPLV